LNLLGYIKDLFAKPESKEWLDNLVNDLERKQKSIATLPCWITDIKDNGLIVKVSGLYAFMSFNHAFWRYYFNESWKAVFPKLLNQKFYCQVYNITKKPISIIVNGDLPQFTEAELQIGEKYPGIIIAKKDFGVFIEIGYHFDWRCGSIVGLMFKPFFGTEYSFEDCKTGDEIEATYIKTDDKGHLLFSNDQKNSDWYFDKPQELVGQIITVRIKKSPDNKEIEYLVKDKYRGILNLRKDDYPLKYRKRLRHFIRILPDGAMINCEVTGFNIKDKTLDLFWITELDIEFGFENSLQNNLDPETVRKLKSLL
jgi:ribosomal protein S1